MLLALVGLAGCEADAETEWAQFNADDNSVTIEVGSAELLDAVAVQLTSNTDSVKVGAASVTPGGGPVNTTTYELRVEVVTDYADDIGRVSVRTDSGERGEDEYDLVADTTGQGIWVFEMVALGEEGETRSDVLTFRLWQESTTEAE